MTAQNLYQIISKVCAIDIDNINPDSDFWQDFNSEPTQMQELREIIEDSINETFEDNDYEKVNTVNDLISLIEEYSNEFIE